MIFPFRAVKRPILLAAVPLLAVVAKVPFWSPLVSKVEAAVSSVSAPSITTGIGYAVDAPIVLDSAPNGLAGFEMTISLSDPAIATIDSVVIPTEFGMTYIEHISTSEVKVMGADLAQALQGSLSGVTLATLNMTTAKQGASEIHIDLTRLEDDSGVPIDNQVLDGSLNFKKRFKGGTSDGSDGGGSGGGGGNKGGGKAGGPKK